MGDPSATAGLEPRYDVVDGIETRYYREGSGKPVVLIHGGPWGSPYSSNDWSLNIEPLARDFEVFALDRLGCGLTESPESPSEFLYGNEVDHLKAFIHQMKIGRCHLIGSSRGAGLAGAVAVDLQDTVQSLVILNTGTMGYKLGPDIIHRREKIFEDLDELDLDARERHRRMTRKYCHEYDHITENYVAAGAYIDQHEQSQRTTEMMTHSVFSRYETTLYDKQRQVQAAFKFGDIELPILVYWGRNDPTAILEQGMHLFDLIAQGNPRTTMSIINNCGHFPYREYPGLFNDDIRRFISSV